MEAKRSFSGFTLIELIVVIILVGIITAVVIPRFVGTNTYAVRGVADSIIASIQYARQIAFSQTSATVTFSVTAANFAVAVDGSNISRPLAEGDYPIALSEFSVSGVSLSPVTTLTFDSLGGTNSGVNIAVTGSENTINICVEVTGYVREC